MKSRLTDFAANLKVTKKDTLGIDKLLHDKEKVN